DLREYEHDRLGVAKQIVIDHVLLGSPWKADCEDVRVGALAGSEIRVYYEVDHGQATVEPEKPIGRVLSLQQTVISQSRGFLDHAISPPRVPQSYVRESQTCRSKWAPPVCPPDELCRATKRNPWATSPIASLIPGAGRVGMRGSYPDGGCRQRRSLS